MIGALNTEQIEDLRRELEETDRKKFDMSDISDVFRMLQYWSKSVGAGEEKIKSVTELTDGYLCRVNRTFHDSMKEFLRQVRTRRFSDQMKERKVQGAVKKYERLMKEAEEEKSKEAEKAKGPPKRP
jgi:hypothetical protein